MDSTTCNARLQTALALTRRVSDQRLFPLLLETILTTIFTVALVYFVCQRWSHKSRSSRLTLFFAVLMYALAVVLWALDVRILNEYMYPTMAWELSPTKDRAQEEVLLNVLNDAQTAQNVITQAIYVMTDVITLWRVYVVFQKPRWLLALLVFTGLVETGFSISVVYLASVTTPASSAHQQDVYRASYLTVGVSTTICQVFSSAMIGYKAWSHWREIKEFINASASRRLVPMLLLIVEIGAVYSALWIWFNLIWAYNSSWNETAFYWSDFYMVTLAAMYPTLVIMLVAAHGSIVERSFQLPSRASAMEIAVPVIATVVDREAVMMPSLHPFSEIRDDKKPDATLSAGEKAPDNETVLEMSFSSIEGDIARSVSMV
ncbi:unnamed protein product [Peniophora sp. CBMAI 1063]|nr:unnamed protein product [Peniophora sp. CBMAI 1063]